jgi:signal transduction histidine kinase
MPLILLPSVLAFIPVVVPSWFHFIVIEKTADNPIVTKWGIVALINFYMSYALYALSTLVIIVSYIKRGKSDRARFLIIIIGIFIPAFIALSTFFGWIKSPGFDITPASFSFFFLLVSVALNKYKLFDIIPLATYDVFRNTEEAIVIINSNNRVVKFNEAAAEQYSVWGNLKACGTLEELIGMMRSYAADPLQFEQLEAALQDHTRSYRDSNIKLRSLSANAPSRVYSLYANAFSDSAAHFIGRLISLRDVTNDRQNVAEYERNRLAREIHDSLSNRLTVAAMNLEYVLLAAKLEDNILDSIQTSLNSVRCGFIDLRRIINELTPVDLEKNGLQAALSGAFAKFNSQNASVDLVNLLNDDEEIRISQSQLAHPIYTICLEAANNALLHGKAKHITVSLRRSGEEVQLFIADDGMGCKKIIKNKGLTGMEQRVAEFHGAIEFGSPDDGGFIIKATFPYRVVMTG